MRTYFINATVACLSQWGLPSARAEPCDVPGHRMVWPEHQTTAVLSIVGTRIIVLDCLELDIGDRSYRAELASVHHHDLQIRRSADGEPYIDWRGTNLGTPRNGICAAAECVLEVEVLQEFPDRIYNLVLVGRENPTLEIEILIREPPLLHRLY